MNSAAPPSRWMVIVAFALVYVFWGSTYLAIGIGVEHIPPALMCAVRFIIAGVVMLAWCALTGRRIRHSSRELMHMAVVGILLLMGGNLTLSYAEQVVPTGLSALLIAVTFAAMLAGPTIGRLIDTYGERRMLSVVNELRSVETASSSRGQRARRFPLSRVSATHDCARHRHRYKSFMSADVCRSGRPGIGPQHVSPRQRQ